MKKLLTGAVACALAVTAQAASPEILVDEDFSLITAGSAEAPEMSAPLSNISGSYEDTHIDSSLTHAPGWRGSDIFAAGGCVYLKSPDSYTGATLFTPLGDYSGDVTISFRVKNANEDKDAQLMLDIMHGNYKWVDADPGCSWTLDLPKGRGWQQVTYTTRNLTSNDNTFLEFYVSGEALIDDVKVTAADTYVAAPTCSSAFGFSSDGFKVSWSPVRNAEEYRMRLYKMNYTNDSDLNETLDFETLDDKASNLSDTWNLSPLREERASDQGQDGSKGLALQNGDIFVTDIFDTSFNKFKYWLRVVPENGDPANLQGMELHFSIFDGRDRMNVMSDDLAGIYDFENPTSFNFHEAVQYFTQKYYGVKLRVTGGSAGSRVILDNIEYGIYRPGKLELVPGADNEYTATTDTELEVKVPDPQGEYFFKVQSCKGSIISDARLQHAFGLQAPVANAAADVTKDSFKASWSASQKAQNYEVRAYGLISLPEDRNHYALLSETFDAVRSEADLRQNAETLGNKSETSLDQYTAMPGWTGVANSLYNGMLGCAYDMDVDRAYVSTPVLNLGNADSFSLKIKAYGESWDGLVVKPFSSDDFERIYFQSDEEGNGYIDETVTLPVSSPFDRILIFANSGSAFLIDELEITQNLHKGDEIMTFLGSAAGATEFLEYTFTDLARFNMTDLVYSVNASYSVEGETATSDNSEYVHVKLGETSVGSISEGEAVVEGYYTLDGLRHDKPVKGINIVKMSDNTCRKIRVR